MSKVKICGLRCVADVDAVNVALPDFVGFVFADSHRRIDEVTASVMKEKLDTRILAVGVFVNQEIEYIANLYLKGVIDLVQLHGEEDDGYIRRLRERTGSQASKIMRIIKAVAIGKALPALPHGADYLLFDTASKQRGGTGEAFDWGILKDYHGQPFFIAGGLSKSTVVKAMALLAPFCVDVSSGVETAGVKDAEKIAEFVRMVRKDSS
ncbi:MAG: phosphoribosylanthranilate isomerase [Dehalococcoidia bacterium]|nr:phosphoribosylanthranilate isomerase [Dehalococcoidia bacterium]